MIDFTFSADLKNRFEMNAATPPFKPTVLKKRPVNAAHDIVRSSTTETEASNNDLTSALKKLNPVKEMQIRGRNNNNDVRCTFIENDFH